MLLSACATPTTPEVGADGKSSPTGTGSERTSPTTAPVATAPNSGAAEPKSAERAPVKGASSPAPSGPAASVPTAPAPEPQVKAEQMLTEGTELYERGDYRGAIRKLAVARDTAPSPSSTRQSSLKYLAFSYCVTGQKPLCKAQFASLLEAAPDFQLGRSEAGHPLWGPVFREAKKESAAPASATSKIKK